MLIVQVNVRSLTPERITELTYLLGTFSVDIVCINETWLKPGKSVRFPGYKILRFDRPGSQKGGGVAILFKEDLEVDDLGGAVIDKCEIQLAKVKINGVKHIKLASVYCPPGTPLSDNAFNFIKAQKGLLMCGDFNAHHPDLGTKNSKVTPSGSQLISIMERHSLLLLSQGETTYTSPKGSTESLDLFIASEDVAKIVESVEVYPDIDSDHLPVALHIRSKASDTPSFPEIRFDLNRMNLGKFQQQVYEECHKIDEEISSPEQIPLIANQLKTIVEDAQRDWAPQCGANQLRSWRPNSEIIRAIKQRRIARRLFEQIRTNDAKHDYNLASKKVKLLIKKSRLEHFRRRCDQLNKLLIEKPRLFWKEFNYLANNTGATSARSYPPLSDGSQQIAYTDQEKADRFANYLQEVWSTPDDPKFCAGTADLVDRTLKKYSKDLSPVNTARQDRTGRWTFNTIQVQFIVKKLKCTAPGEDGITNALLKRCPPIFWDKATMLFNAIVRYGSIPEEWKKAVVTMLPKEGKDWRKPNGYRPISLLNSLAKMLERLLARAVTAELRARKILPPSQSGFLSEHSVEDHPFRLAQTCASGIEFCESTVVACLDVQGAFDRMWHNGCRYKTISFGFPAIGIGILSNFLHGRLFRTRIGKKHSAYYAVTGGVPQGSPLSPIMYVLFTADMPRDIPCYLQNGIFADDLALWKKHKDVEVAIKLVNVGLARVDSWFCKWRLSINASKSQAFIATLKTKASVGFLTVGGKPIDWVDVVKYLGVHFDKNMSWKTHILKAIDKADNRTSTLSRLCGRRFGLSKTVAITVFKTYVRPVLTFGSPAWAGLSNNLWEKLEVSQNKALRVALRLPPWSNVLFTRQLAGVAPIREYALELAANWLDRALAANNLVAVDARRAWEEGKLGRPYLNGKTDPLTAIVAFDDSRG